MYEDWGFSGSPFQTTSLPPSELGEKLLVGRDEDLGKLMRRIKSAPKMATVEGLNGVGKTSIVNVAAYKLYVDHITSGHGSLFIPCRKPFQLNRNHDVSVFIEMVYLEVAQTLLDHAARLKANGTFVKSSPIEKWLNSSQLTTYGGGISVITANVQSETNTSSGFEKSGFRKSVTDWLADIFSESANSGVICTIDNLELLQKSDTARALLEQLRDELFTVRGLRWVLCGSLGIVHGIMGSPRLEGYLHDPLQIGEIAEDAAPEILVSRINTFSVDNQTSYLPLTPNSFDDLYQALRGNLRSVLSYADNYCQWVADRALPSSDEEKDALFSAWLNGQCEAAYDAIRSEVRPRAMKVFTDAEEISGIFSPSDYEFFDFNSIAAFRPSIQSLEGVGVLVSTQDEGDKRRKTIQFTPKGWMVLRHMRRMAL